MHDNKPRHPLVSVLLLPWTFVKFMAWPLVIGFFLLQWLTPSLNFTSKSGQDGYRNDTTPYWQSVGTYGNQDIQAYHTTLLTHDGRALVVDYIAPQSTLGTGPIPLTIIIAPLTDPDWLLQQVRPNGHNAVVIYHPPRMKRMTGSVWPTAAQLKNPQKINDYWEIMATNPINKYYSLYMGLHEGVNDIVDIATWAQEHIRASVSNMNIIGLGSGTLIAAAAAHKLEVIGLHARTLSLIYPPADLASAINDNLRSTPQWLRKPSAIMLSLLYTRLQLSQHLPQIVETKTFLLLPEKSFDLATYAANPAKNMIISKDSSIEYIDAGYQSIYNVTLDQAIRNHVGQWLVNQNAITTY